MAKRVKSIIGWSSGISISEDDDVPDRVIFYFAASFIHHYFRLHRLLLILYTKFQCFYNIMTSQSNLELENFLHSS